MTGIRTARLAAGMTQAAAGQLIGVNQSHFGKLERGTVRLLAEDALTLAHAFGVDIVELIKVSD
jgi:transcriptional regulator with XRE-family HTH domain